MTTTPKKIKDKPNSWWETLLRIPLKRFLKNQKEINSLWRENWNSNHITISHDNLNVVFILGKYTGIITGYPLGGGNQIFNTSIEVRSNEEMVQETKKIIEKHFL